MTKTGNDVMVKLPDPIPLVSASADQYRKLSRDWYRYYAAKSDKYPENSIVLYLMTLSQADFKHVMAILKFTNSVAVVKTEKGSGSGVKSEDVKDEDDASVRKYVCSSQSEEPRCAPPWW